MQEHPERRATIDPAPPWFREPSFGQRAGAAFLDVLLFLALAFLLSRLPIALSAQRWIAVAVTMAYLVGGVALTGRTVGKRLLGVRVVDVATGRLPSPKAALLRWVVPAAPALVGWVSPEIASYTTWFSFVVYLPILKRPQHRGIHDLVAGTIVTGTATLT